jgi:16S rRNA (guanine966-N2)-methyltransferase
MRCDPLVSMRIIGGDARGRPIRLPTECRVRPTADRVKKSLFDILNPIEGQSFLDLFAGSGNIGLEALSRRVRVSAFVERDPRLIKVIRAGVSRLGFTERAEVIGADVQRGLEHLNLRGLRFDIIFADPPYEECWIRKTLCWMEESDVLTDHGIVVLQHSVREQPEGSWTHVFFIADQRRYGDTMLSFLHKKNQEKVS